jgi:carbon-monoxide dehydrogenase large subunit
MRFALGQSAPRVEDQRLLRGGGRYTDDINLEGQASAFMLRSPYAHAHISSIDTTDALSAPGVIAVYTGADIATAELGYMPCLAAKLLPLKRSDGSPMYEPKRAALVKNKVAFVGDYVAFIVAENRSQARDAAELIDVDYEELPPVVEIQTPWPKMAHQFGMNALTTFAFKWSKAINPRRTPPSKRPIT